MASDRAGNTPLHLAASGDATILATLLRCHVIDINARNLDRNTPLHYFMQRFASPNYMVPWSLFISRGANLNEQNKYGETPLHKACLNGAMRLIMVELLLKEPQVRKVPALVVANRIGWN
jgi:ankyrin repeat protein